MLAFLLAPQLMLPDHVGGPGAGRFAIGAGVVGLERGRGAEPDKYTPCFDLRVGFSRLVAMTVEAEWNHRAPLVGTQLRFAVGRSRGQLFGLGWLEGHLRPALADITEPLAGADVGAGLGIAAVGDWVALGIDGGVALGFPMVDVDLEEVDSTLRHRVDQRGGLYGIQRAYLSTDLGDHVELALKSTLDLPVASVNLHRRNEDLIGDWDLRLGAEALVRW